MLCFLFLFGFSILDINEELTGSWNTTVFSLDQKGIETANTTFYYNINIFSKNNENNLIGNVYRISNGHINKSVFTINIQKLSKSNSNIAFSVIIRKSDETDNIVDEVQTFNVSLNLDDMITSVGRTKNELQFSLNVATKPTIAELTVLDKKNNQIIIYKSTKKANAKRINLMHLLPLIPTILYNVGKSLLTK